MGYPSTRNSKSLTRAAILDRALEMSGRRLAKLAAVVEDLGRTTGYGYQIWSRQDDYYHDLTALIALQPWVVDGKVHRINLVRAIRHCDHVDLADRFLELVYLGDSHPSWTGSGLLWWALIPSSDV